MASFRADAVLEKMDIKDPDFRYMAVSDLAKECVREDFKLDPESERKIVAKLLYLIANDNSGDVKSVAIKCLSPLSLRCTDTQFNAMIDGLTNNILAVKASSTPETQDLSTIGLKYVIESCPEHKGSQFVTDLAPKLINQIKNPKTAETVWYCLDIQNDILSRWGKEMASQGQTEKLQGAILPHLTSDNNRARQKAVGCLGYMCLSLSEDLLNSLLNQLIEKTKSAKKKEHLRAYAQALGAVCRSADRSKLAGHLKNILPLLFKNIDHDKEEFKDDEELKDNCFQCLEALLNRCPKESEKFFEKIQTACLKFIAWDPLVIEDDDDEVPVDEDDAFLDDEVIAGDSGEVVDDEDMSWKVRKAATKCIQAIVKTRPDKLSHIYDHILPTLIKRFKEREENVKLDIMVVVGEVLRQTHQVYTAESDSKTSRSLIKKLTAMAPEIHKSATKELTSKSPKSRIGGFQLLRELANVLPESFKDGSFVEGISQALVSSSSSALKMEALDFLRVVISPKTGAAFADQLPTIAKSVYVMVNDTYYKITADGLRVCCQIIRAISGMEGFNPEPFVNDLYGAILPKLKLTDVDLEVKDCAIEATGLLISSLSSKLKEAQINECLDIFSTRLSNELTRLSSIKTLDQIAKAKVSLGNVLGDTIKALSGFLCKTNRQLIHSSLLALHNIIRGKDGKAKAAKAQYENLLKDIVPLVDVQDVQLAHLALQVVKVILHANPDTITSIKTLILPKCNILLVSKPGLTGQALKSMLDLFKELGACKNKKVTPESLVEGLTKLAVGDLPKTCYLAIAQCIAVLVASNEAGREASLDKFVKNIKSAKEENQKLLALYCVGEIGTRTDITDFTDLRKNILSSFDATSEEVRYASSVAFGCVCCCNISKFLEEVKAQPKRKALLLGSLREIIVRLSGSKEGKEVINPHFEQLLALLLEHTNHEDESTRTLVSECLGKMTLINSEQVLTALKDRTKDKSHLTRSCVTLAVKYTIFEKTLPVDKVLSKNITSFLELLSDNQIMVRKAVILSLSSAAHQKPNLIRDALPKYLTLIYDQTRIRPELIKEVELGPFKHKVDEGLETRQATFECMYTMLDTCLSRLELQEFISKLVSGLTDEYDIQCLNHQILIRLAKRAGSALLAGLEQLIPPLTTCVKSVAKDATNAEAVERNNELIRSALRAIAVIHKLPDIAETAPKFLDFIKSVVQQGELGKMYTEAAKTATL